MALPTLTHTQTAYTSTGYTAPTGEQVIEALNTAAANLTQWTKTAVDDSTWKYIEFSAPNSSPVSCKILVTAGNTTGMRAPDSVAANFVYVGLAPDGGTLGSYNSTTPYGADRWLGYWKCVDDVKAESLYFIESDETLSVIMRDDSADAFFGFDAGAIFVAPSGNGEDADGRVYGLSTGGGRSMTFVWNTTSDFPIHVGSNGYAHMACFRPNSPTTIDNCTRLTEGQSSATYPRTAQDGTTQLAETINIGTTQSPYYWVGRYRQRYIPERTQCRSPQTNGVILGKKQATQDLAMLFGNS